ncbi:unnamed protein product, partial [Closterium sp. Yama58-4]
SSPPVEPNESGSLSDFRSPPESRGTGSGVGTGMETGTGVEAGAGAETADRAELLPGLPVKGFYSGSSDGSGYLPSAASSSTGDDGSEVLGDLFMWGEGLGDGALGGGGLRKRGTSSAIPIPGFDSVVPKQLDSGVVLDVSHVACGEGHAALVTRRGEVFCWGEEGGGRLGQGRERDLEHPKLVEGLDGIPMDEVSCGSFVTLALSRAGEAFLWGDGRRGRGLLGEGGYEDMPQWVPRRMGGALDGLYLVQVACGPWHVAAVAATGQLFTFGDGTFGALGHGNCDIVSSPKEVESLRGMRVSRVACGVWHTAAVVHAPSTAGTHPSTASSGATTASDGAATSSAVTSEGDSAAAGAAVAAGGAGAGAGGAVGIGGGTKAGGLAGVGLAGGVTAGGVAGPFEGGRLYTWGDGDRFKLGHGDKQQQLLPKAVDALSQVDISQVACGQDITVALTPSGHVYAMGSAAHGQLGNPQADGHTPALVSGPPLFNQIEQIACGTHHTAALTASSDLFTWGQGSHGQLGHGDVRDREVPTRVEAIKDQRVLSVSCGPASTAVVCQHRHAQGSDHHHCTLCRQAFSFARIRHHCYNCSLPVCHACSPRKLLGAAMAPTPTRPYRVCDACFNKMMEPWDWRQQGGAVGSGEARWRKAKEEADKEIQRLREELRAVKVRSAEVERERQAERRLASKQVEAAFSAASRAAARAAGARDVIQLLSQQLTTLSQGLPQGSTKQVSLAVTSLPAAVVYTGPLLSSASIPPTLTELPPQQVTSSTAAGSASGQAVAEEVACGEGARGEGARGEGARGEETCEEGLCGEEVRREAAGGADCVGATSDSSLSMDMAGANGSSMGVALNPNKSSPVSSTSTDTRTSTGVGADSACAGSSSTGSGSFEGRVSGGSSSSSSSRGSSSSSSSSGSRINDGSSGGGSGSKNSRLLKRKVTPRTAAAAAAAAAAAGLQPLTTNFSFNSWSSRDWTRSKSPSGAANATAAVAAGIAGRDGESVAAAAAALAALRVEEELEECSEGWEGEPDVAEVAAEAEVSEATNSAEAAEAADASHAAEASGKVEGSRLNGLSADVEGNSCLVLEGATQEEAVQRDEARKERGGGDGESENEISSDSPYPSSQSVPEGKSPSDSSNISKPTRNSNKSWSFRSAVGMPWSPVGGADENIDSPRSQWFGQVNKGAGKSGLGGIPSGAAVGGTGQGPDFWAASGEENSHDDALADVAEWEGEEAEERFAVGREGLEEERGPGMGVAGEEEDGEEAGEEEVEERKDGSGGMGAANEQVGADAVIRKGVVQTGRVTSIGIPPVWNGICEMTPRPQRPASRFAVDRGAGKDSAVVAAVMGGEERGNGQLSADGLDGKCLAREGSEGSGEASFGRITEDGSGMLLAASDLDENAAESSPEENYSAGCLEEGYTSYAGPASDAPGQHQYVDAVRSADDCVGAGEEEASCGWQYVPCGMSRGETWSGDREENAGGEGSVGKEENVTGEERAYMEGSARGEEITGREESASREERHGRKHRSRKLGDGEWVEQPEPGVYVTLAKLPGEGTELRRIRFSRKVFMEKQAETWWAENKAAVTAMYHIISTAKKTVEDHSIENHGTSRNAEPSWGNTDSSSGFPERKRCTRCREGYDKAPVKVGDVPKAALKKAAPQARPTKPPTPAWRPAGTSKGLFEKTRLPTTRSNVLRRSSSSAPVAARSSNATVIRRSSTTAISDPSKGAPAATIDSADLTYHLTAAVQEDNVTDHFTAVHDKDVADDVAAEVHEENAADSVAAAIHEDVADQVEAAIHEENVADHSTSAVHDEDLPDHITAPIHEDNVADHLIAADSHSVKATDLDTQAVTQLASNHEKATNEVTRYVFQRRDSAGHCAGNNAGPGRHILTMTKQLIENTLEVKVESCWDIDAQDRENPLAETTYVADIYNHYKMTEKEGMVCPTYMSAQPEVNSRIRGVVLDWVVQVHESYNLMPETLFLAVNIFDRYLATTHVLKKHIQLVGATCIMIAAKYEEIYPPLVADFEDIGAGAYTRGQIRMMEKQILNTISFKLSIPTCYMFAARYLNFAKAAADAATASKAVSNGWSIEVSKGTSSRVHAFAWYLLELTIPEINMVQFSPSHLAAAAVYTALLGAYQKGKAAKSTNPESSQTITHRRPTNEGEIWGSRMADLTGFEAQELWHCVGLLLELYKTALSSRCGAVYKKYKGKKFLEAATYPAPQSADIDALSSDQGSEGCEK